MPLRDVLWINAIVMIWGLNIAVSKWTLSGDGGDFAGLPPFFFAALRFLVVAALLAPLLRPFPKQWGVLFIIAMMLGAVHFGLMYLGLGLATTSSVAVALQMVVPMTVVLSIVVLGERVGPWRLGGIGLSVFGVALMAFDPQTFSLSLGVLLAVGSALCGAIGTIAIKRLHAPLGPLRVQAWIAAFSAFPMIAGSLLLERGQIESWVQGGWGVWGALAYVVIASSLIGHSGYFLLLRRHDASMVAPWMVLVPLWGLGAGVLVMGDPFSAREAVGAAAALIGVSVIALRSARRLRLTPPDGEPRATA